MSDNKDNISPALTETLTATATETATTVTVTVMGTAQLPFDFVLASLKPFPVSIKKPMTACQYHHDATVNSDNDTSYTAPLCHDESECECVSSLQHFRSDAIFEPRLLGIIRDYYSTRTYHDLSSCYVQ
jgi:hypothetical protein